MANSEDTSPGHNLRFISDIGILTCADWIKAFADYAGENCPWGIITSKTSFYESRTIVNDYCLICHIFLLPTNNASLGSAAPYFLPKAEGCSGDAPFLFLRCTKPVQLCLEGSFGLFSSLKKHRKPKNDQKMLEGQAKPRSAVACQHSGQDQHDQEQTKQ